MINRIPISILTTFVAFSCASPHAEERPNVILVLTDDQGYGDVGIHGNNIIRTPNIDHFANNNIRLDRNMVSAVSAPTRASLLTGRYHLATGVNWVTRRKEVMNQGEVTIAEIFADAGYATGCFGKWHNGAQYPHNPNGQGFSEFFGFCGGHIDNYFDPILEHNGEKVQTKGYIADVITDRSIDFIEKNKKRPFFCYISYNTPHGPFQVEDRYFDYYKSLGLSDRDAAIYGMCENIDDNFGRVLDNLEQLGLDDNTIIIYMTDNGPFGVRYNAQMRGVKATLHEGGVRTPLFISLPNVDNRGIISELTAHIDMLPTLTELCDIPIPDTLDLHGISLAPLIKGETKKLPKRTIFFHDQPWVFQELPAGAVRTDRYRLVCEESNDTTLFDMKYDPNQLHDIASKKPALVRDLLKDYHEWFMNVTDGGEEPQQEPIEIGHDCFKRVEMPVHESYLIEGVYYAGKQGWANDWAINFRDDVGVATWRVKVVEDGHYDVYMQYAVSTEYCGFDLNVNIGDVALSAKITKASVLDKLEKLEPHKFNSAVKERNWGTLKLGTMYLTKNECVLKVSTSNIKNENDFALKGIIIRER